MTDSGVHVGGRSSRLTLPLAVLAGGFVGSLARACLAAAFAVADGGFPWVTLIVNVLGSLVIGWYLARRERSVTSRWSLHFWAIGALGSFTTFSAFSVEVVELIDGGARGLAASYVIASMVLGLVAAWLGDRVGSAS